MTWIIQSVIVGVLVYFMVDGYRALKERRAQNDRLNAELDRYTKGT